MKGQRIAVAIGMVIGGCTGSQLRLGPSTGVSPVHVPIAHSAPPTSDATSSYTYELLRPGETRLLQVFDDSRRTYLTFEGQAPLGLLIFDQRGRAVPFTVAERTAIVDGVREGLLVRTPTKMSYAQAPRRAALAQVSASTAGGEEGAPGLPAELAAARAEILQAQERLSGLFVELDKASRGEPSASFAQLRSEIEEIQTTIDGVTATLVRAHFASGSAVLTLSTEAQDALLATARRAGEIRIQGGADNSGPVALNDFLARERAKSMRRLLIAGGVAVDRVRTTSSQAECVASNSTALGRAQNRRVDVVFANHAPPVAQNGLGAGSSPATSLTDQ